MTNKLPKDLQGVLWSRSIKDLDLEKDKNYIIHQILAYGTWNHVLWLFRNYTVTKMRKVFENDPEKDYTEQSFNFAKNILIETSKNLDKQKYVKNFPRIIRY